MGGKADLLVMPVIQFRKKISIRTVKFFLPWYRTTPKVGNPTPLDAIALPLDGVAHRYVEVLTRMHFGHLLGLVLETEMFFPSIPVGSHKKGEIQIKSDNSPKKFTRFDVQLIFNLTVRFWRL